MANPLIWQVKLPDNQFYEIEDKYARGQIAAGIKFEIAWNGTGTPNPDKIPAGVKVKPEGGEEVTGTLAASAAAANTFYLVASKVNEGAAEKYDEYVPVGDPKTWEKIGDTSVDISTLGELAYKDNVVLTLGKIGAVTSASQIIVADSNVSFAYTETGAALGVGAELVASVGSNKAYLSANRTDDVAVAGDGTASAYTSYNVGTAVDVLPAGAEFTTEVTPEVKHIKATASGTAVSSTDSAFVTGFVAEGSHPTASVVGVDATFTTTVTPSTTKLGANVTDVALSVTNNQQFVTDVPGTFTYLTTATVHDTPTLNKEHMVIAQAVPSVSYGSSKLVTTEIPNVTAATDVTVPVVSSNTATNFYAFSSAQPVQSGVDWKFEYQEGTGADAAHGTLVISGGNGTPVTPTQHTATNTVFGTDATASKVTLGAVITAATGAVDAAGEGADVINSVTVGTPIDVATGALSASGAGAEVGIGITAGNGIDVMSATTSDTTGIKVMTGVGTLGKTAAVTAVSVSAQPTVTITSGNDSGVEVATGISGAITGFANKDAKTVLTGVKGFATSNALTGVSVSAQPTIAITEGTDSDFAVVTGITDASTTTSDSTSIVSADTISFGTASVLTGVQVTAQPVFAIASGAIGDVEYVYNVAADANVSVVTADTVTAYTSLGTATAAAQAITISNLTDVVAYNGTDIAIN